MSNSEASIATNPCPVPAGILLIIGGKEEKNYSESKKGEGEEELEILKAFIKLTGKEDPVLEVITTASSKGPEMYKDYLEVFSRLKISRVGHVHHTTRLDTLKDDLTERIRAADAFFFTGGDQLMLTSIYGGTNFLTLIKERYIGDRIVVAGTSAGAMAMSTPMIYAGNKQVQQITGEVKITTGLEFLKDVCIDTHFIDRSRFIRMAQVIATNPTCIGIGIEEDTAIVVREGLIAEVIGNGVITVIEGFELTASNIAEFSEGKAVFIKDLRVHLLARGCKYDIPQANPPHI